MDYRSLVLAAAVVLTGGSWAARGETLQQALVVTYMTSPTLRAARSALGQQDEAVSQAQSNWRPTVNLSGDAGRAQLQTNLVSPSQQTLSPADLGVSVTQPLYRGGQTEAQTAQAQAAVKAGRAQLDATEESVLLDAISAYLSVERAEAIVALERENEQALQRQLASTKAQQGVGGITATDVAQAAAAVAGAHGALIQAQGSLAVAAATYATVIGHPPEDTGAAEPAKGLPTSLDALTRAALDDNPGVLAQQYLVEAAEHGIDLAAGALLPQVSVLGSATRALDESFAGSHTVISEVLLNVTVPLYQQGAEYSRIRQQKLAADQQRQLLDQIRLTVVGQAATAWQNLQSAQAQIEAYQTEIGAAETALAGRQKQFDVGVSSELDILQAREALVTAQINLVNARHDATLAGYQVKAAIGQATARALGLPVQFFDPAQHYQDVQNRWIGTNAGQGDQK